MKKITLIGIVSILLFSCTQNNINSLEKKKSITEVHVAVFSEEETTRILNEYTFFDEGKIKHTFYDYKQNNGETVYLVFTQSDMFSCHMCYVYMSVFLVDKNNIIKEKYIKALETGSWGTPPPKDYMKIHSHNNEFFITNEGGYSSGGYFEKSLFIYYPIGNIFTQIGAIPVAYNNFGVNGEDSLHSEGWEAEYDFSFNENSLPDILLNIKGKNNQGEILEKKVYVFNGEKYVLGE